MRELYPDEMQKFFAHFPTEVSQDICKFATDVVFKNSRYIFTRRVGKKQFGYCTHCRTEYQTDGLKHKSLTRCPSCDSECRVKASGISRKRLIDEAYFVYYEKSVINPDAIIARGIYAVRDYRDDYHDVQTLFETKAAYLFEPGNPILLYRPYLYYADRGMINLANWEKSASIRSMMNSSMANKACYVSRESIEKAVKGTPYQYSMWKEYRSSSNDWVDFFGLFSLYPSIEYLTKLGLKDVVDSKLHGHRTYGAVNWRGDDVLSVLKLSKQQMKEVRKSGIEITPVMLRLMQISNKDGSDLPVQDIAILSRLIGGRGLDDLKIILKYTTLRKAYNYLHKQNKRYPEHKYRMANWVITWKDYIGDCRKLEMDLGQEQVLFPKNLYQAHQNTIKQIKITENERASKKIRARLKSLQKYNFESGEFLIRAAADIVELINEGKALQHCVGTYAENYADGKTDILLVRKKDDPDKPFYTMEIRKGQIIQCRGKRNCPPTREVERFIDIFKTEKLKQKSAKVGVAV